MNYRDIKEKYITSLQYSDVRPSSGNTFIPCVVLVKGDNSQEAFPVLQKQEARNPDLFFNPSVNSKGSCQKSMLS